MPISIEYTKDTFGVIAYHDGLSTSKDIFDALITIYQDERFPSLNYCIEDLSKAKKLEVTFEEMKEIATLEAQESERNPGFLLAIVIGTDETYALASMFKAFAHMSKSDIEVVATREKADELVLLRMKKVSQSDRIEKHSV